MNREQAKQLVAAAFSAAREQTDDQSLVRELVALVASKDKDLMTALVVLAQTNKAAS